MRQSVCSEALPIFVSPTPVIGMPVLPPPKGAPLDIAVASTPGAAASRSSSGL